jgi:CelD/BcsL family acetyltransferase involved in cellulose biosynthesis
MSLPDGPLAPGWEQCLGHRSVEPTVECAKDVLQGVEATLVEDFEVLCAVAGEWDELVSASETPTSFFLTSMCILPFWKWHGTGRQLTVMLVRDRGGRLVGAVPFYRERVGRRLSRHWRLALLGSPESGADYLDVLARPSYRSAVWHAAFTCLARRGIRWDAVNLNYILDDSPTLALLQNGREGPRFRVHTEPSSACPFVVLKPTWDEFRASLGGSTRRGVQYKCNVIKRTFKEVRFEEITDECRVPGLIGKMLEYKQAKYGHQFDCDYAAWPDQAIAALRRGCLRFWVLWFDDEAACFWFSFMFNGRAFFQACSYKPEYARLSPGNVLIAHAIRAAIEEGAVEYDLKRGATEYKDHWASGRRQTLQVHAVRRGPRGVWIGLWEYSPLMANVRRRARRANTRARQAAKWVLRPLARHCPALLPARLRARVLSTPAESTPP